MVTSKVICGLVKHELKMYVIFGIIWLQASALAL